MHDTPETPTIASLVELANARALAGRTDWTAADTLKNVVLAVRRPGAERAELLVIGLPGDREVDLKRVEAALAPATVAVFDDWAAHPERSYDNAKWPAGVAVNTTELVACTSER